MDYRSSFILVTENINGIRDSLIVDAQDQCLLIEKRLNKKYSELEAVRGEPRHRSGTIECCEKHEDTSSDVVLGLIVPFLSMDKSQGARVLETQINGQCLPLSSKFCESIIKHFHEEEYSELRVSTAMQSRRLEQLSVLLSRITINIEKWKGLVTQELERGTVSLVNKPSYFPLSKQWISKSAVCGACSNGVFIIGEDKKVMKLSMTTRPRQVGIIADNFDPVGIYEGAGKDLFVVSLHSEVVPRFRVQVMYPSNRSELTICVRDPGKVAFGKMALICGLEDTLFIVIIEEKKPHTHGKLLVVKVPLRDSILEISGATSFILKREFRQIRSPIRTACFSNSYQGLQCGVISIRPSFSAELWFLPASSTFSTVIFSCGSKHQEEIFIEVNASSNEVLIRGGRRTPFEGVVAATTRLDNVEGFSHQWSHICVVYECRTWRLVLNGRTVGTIVDKDLEKLHDNKCVIGRNFNGSIMNFRTWRCARTDFEIERDMRRFMRGDEVSLESCFTLLEGEGSVLFDHGPRKHHTLIQRGHSRLHWLPTKCLPFEGQTSGIKTTDFVPSAIFASSARSPSCCCTEGQIVIAVPRDSRTVSIFHYSLSTYLLLRETSVNVPDEFTFKAVVYHRQRSILAVLCVSNGVPFKLCEIPFSDAGEVGVIHSEEPFDLKAAFAIFGAKARHILRFPSSDFVGVSRLVADPTPKTVHRLINFLMTKCLETPIHTAARDVISLLCLNIRIIASKGFLFPGFSPPEEDGAQLLSRARKNEIPELSNMTRCLEFLAFHFDGMDWDPELLQCALSLLLSERGILQFMMRICGRKREKFEERLFTACALFIEANIHKKTWQSEITSLSSALFSETVFGNAQSDCERNNAVSCLLSIQHVLTSKTYDGKIRGGDYTAQLLRACDMTVLSLLHTIRKDPKSVSMAIKTIASGFVGTLMQTICVIIPFFDPSVLLMLSKLLSSLRDSLMNLFDTFVVSVSTIEVEADACGVCNLINSLSLVLSQISSKLIITGGMSSAPLGYPFQDLFRGGVQKAGTSREVGLTNLQQGVGPIGHLFLDIHKESAGLRNGDSQLFAAEKAAFCALCSALLPTRSLVNPTKGELSSLFGSVKKMRQWILAERQHSLTLVETLEAKANLLSRFEACQVDSRWLPDTPYREESTDPPTRKEWRQMFQTWKAVRKLKSLVVTLQRQQRLTEGDLTQLVVRFLMDTTFEPSVVERQMQSVAQRGTQIVVGLEGIRQLLEEFRAKGRTCHTIMSLTMKTLCGWHYLSGLDGCPVDVIARVRGAYFHLLSDVQKYVKETGQIYWKNILVAMLCTKWNRGDFCKIHPSIPSWLLSESGGEALPAYQVRMHSLPLSVTCTKVYPENCAPSIVPGVSGLVIKSSGGRGCCVLPSCWKDQTVPVFFFEVTVVDLAPNATLAVGVGPPEYHLTRPPGWDKGSYALHDDGVLYCENSSGRQITPVSFGKGDTIGCAWNRAQELIFWTKNKNKIDSSVVMLGSQSNSILCPLIGFDSKGTVKLNFGSDPFVFNFSKLHRDSGFIPNISLPIRCWTTFQLFCCSIAEAYSMVIIDAASGARSADTTESDNGVHAMILSVLVTISDNIAGAPQIQLMAYCEVLALLVSSIKGSVLYVNNELLLMFLKLGEQLASRVDSFDFDFKTASWVLYAIEKLTSVLFPDYVEEQGSTIFRNIGRILFKTADRAFECAITNQPVGWLAVRIIQRLYKKGSLWQKYIHDELCKRFTVAKLKRQQVLLPLAILGGARGLPLPGDRVIRKPNNYPIGTVVWYSIEDEVVEVETDEKERILLSTSSASVADVPLSSFMSADDPLHYEAARSVFSFAETIWSGQNPGKVEGVDAHVGLAISVRILRCIREYLMLGISVSVPQSVINVLPYFLEWSAERPFELVSEEEGFLVTVSHEQPHTRHRVIPAQPLSSTSTLLEESRLRMAQELSMRGFSLEMCLLALEETYYDRSLALRLLTAHQVGEELYNNMEVEEIITDVESEEEDDEESQLFMDEDEDEDDDDNDGDSIMSFSGEIECLDFQADTILKVETDKSIGDSFAIDITVKMVSIDGNPQTILFSGAKDYNLGSHMQLITMDGYMHFGLWSDKPTNENSCRFSLLSEDLEWLRITLVQNWPNLKLYKNGTLMAMVNLSGELGLSSAGQLLSEALFIGGNNITPSFSGSLREMSIHLYVPEQHTGEYIHPFFQSDDCVIRFSFDQGVHHIVNSSTSPNAVFCDVFVIGGGLFWREIGSPRDPQPEVVAEVDFTCQGDDEDIFVVNVSLPTVAQCQSRARYISTAQELCSHYASRILLDLMCGNISYKEHERVPIQSTSTLKLLVRTVCESVDADLFNAASNAFLETMMADSQKATSLMADLLDLAAQPQSLLTYESPHPCRPMSESPKEVNIPKQQYYDLFFDQRGSPSGSTIYTFYTDHTLSNVIAQNSGFPLRIKAPSFFFDVRVDGSGFQWGYRITVVYGGVKQSRAAKFIRLLLKSWVYSAELPQGFADGLVRAIYLNVSKTRRILMNCLIEVLKTPWPKGAVIYCPDKLFMELHEVKKLVEKEYRKEFGLSIHSKFVQCFTQLLIALKDTQYLERKDDYDLKFDNSICNEEEAVRTRFEEKRREQKVLYNARGQNSSNRVELIKRTMSDNLKIEVNSEKLSSLFSEESGGSASASVAVSKGRWYYEVRVQTAGDVTLGVAVDNDICWSPWGVNGRYGVVFSGKDEGDVRLGPKCWKVKDIICVTVDCTARQIIYAVNGGKPFITVEFGTIFCRIEEGDSINMEPYLLDPGTLFSPCFILGAEESIAVNFGVVPFEYEIPFDCLPYDSSNLGVGSLVPYHQIRAFEDISASIVLEKSPPPFLLDERDPFDFLAHREGPQHVSLGGTGDIAVSLTEIRNVGDHFATAIADCSVKGGNKWYYEVTLTSQGLMQIGWMNPNVRIEDKCHGVGDVKDSWAIDLFRRTLWTNGDAILLSQTHRWLYGDTIGCALDLVSKTIFFTVNGRTIFEPRELNFSGPLSPAISLRPGNSCMINFGSSPFRHKLEGFCALGVPDTFIERVNTFYNTLLSKEYVKRIERNKTISYLLVESRPLPGGLPKKEGDVASQFTIYNTFITALDEFCLENNKEISQMTADLASNCVISKVDWLKSYDTHKIFETLRHTSTLAKVVIPLMYYDRFAHTAGNRLFSRISTRLIFFQVRDALVQRILKETNCRSEHFRLSINRYKSRVPNPPFATTVFGQTLSMMGNQHPRLYKSSRRFWTVNFIGEGAEDAGGPFREHISDMCSELMSSQLVLFVPTGNNRHNTGTEREAYVPAASIIGDKYSHMFRFIGRLMGGCMRNAEPMNLLLPTLFWKKLAGAPVFTTDIASVDKTCFQCIQQFMEMDTYGESAEDIFNETFTTETFTTQLSDGSVVELIPNGAAIPVTFARCKEYACAMEKARLSEFDSQVGWIREGLLSVIPEIVLCLLEPKELEIKICGKSDYTVADLKEGVAYEGLTSDDRRMGFLWEVLESATPQQRRLFLKFVSGRERLPVKLRILPLTTTRNPDSLLPKAATCFFAIELPEYSSVDVMRERLMYAIENCVEIDTDYRPMEVGQDDGPHLRIGSNDRHEDVYAVTQQN